MTRASPRRRAVAIGLLSVLPWTVVSVGPVVTLFFPAALLDYNPGVTPPLRVIPLWEFLAAGGRIPTNPDLFPLSLLAYHLALAGALARIWDDRIPDRAIAGLLLFAGLLHLSVPLAFSHRLRYAAFPVATLAPPGVVWWYYGDELWSLFAPVSRDG